VAINNADHRHAAGTARPAPDEAAAIRADRDRFVAFAFSAADILLELDSTHVIRYAAGAVTALLGVGPADLEGRPLLSLAPVQARPVLGELLLAIHDGRRLEPMVVRLQGRGGPTPPMLVVGYQLSNLENRIFLALRMARGLLTGPGTEREAGSGLYSADAFAAAASAKLSKGGPGKLTFIELDRLDDLTGRLDAATQQELATTIGQCLRASSIDGDTAGALDDGRYGIVHDPSLDLDALGQRIEACAKAVDPKGKGVGVRSATLDMKLDGVSGADAARALVYTIHRFSRQRGHPLTVEALSSGLAHKLDSTAKQMASVRSLIVGDHFAPHFQPIVQLMTRRTSHFEALVRFARSDLDLEPYEFIRFAEEVGLIAEFDFAMCRRVFDDLVAATESSRVNWPIAVNISGHSLEEPWFRSALKELLAAHPALRRYLMVEITESMALTDLPATNAFIQELRAEGHKVCLDDFGVGAVAFDYLRALEVDYVKIDGSYVRDAMGSRKGGHFLKAIAGLCRDLGIATVAEMVEEEAQVPFLVACGIDYGQGHLFGRPAARPVATDPLPAARPAARRRGPITRWE
jgi:EAL domain-containing protein (putative c-di-GMP-specific phosphodiesterase class I)/PAS domain-containing protein